MKQQAIAESNSECPKPPKAERQGYAADGDKEHRLLDKRWDGRSAFSVPEVAQILDVAVWSAWAAVKRGEIGTVRLGHRVIVPRYVVERLLTVT
jgi:hypothetical protein